MAYRLCSAMVTFIKIIQSLASYDFNEKENQEDLKDLKDLKKNMLHVFLAPVCVVLLEFTALYGLQLIMNLIYVVSLLFRLISQVLRFEMPQALNKPQ